MKLYGTLTSPYVRKVRVLLREKGLAADFIEANPAAATSLVPTLNPLGKVPVLVRDDGEVLFDSSMIVEYLDTLAEPRLLPPEGEVRWQVQRWHAFANGLIEAVIARLLETRRPAAQQSAERIAREEQRIAHALAWAEAQPRGRAYLLEDRLTLADLVLAVALEYLDFRYPHPWRERHPRLAHWLAGLSTRPALAETQPPGMERAVHAPF
jgi:glutathione S-transferase